MWARNVLVSQHKEPAPFASRETNLATAALPELSPARVTWRTDEILPETILSTKAFKLTFLRFWQKFTHSCHTLTGEMS
jgi:hypothetical protein